MSNYQIISDSCSNLPIEEIKKHDIAIIPMYWIDENGEEHISFDINNQPDLKKFYDKMRQGAVIKTSAINETSFIEFFEQFGKKYGIYLFKDLKKPDKILYAAPLKETNSLGSIEMPRFISPWLIRGNWMLVKVKDFKDSKTGWIQFRGSDGKLRLFVKF